MTFGEAIVIYGFKEAARMLGEYNRGVNRTMNPTCANCGKDRLDWSSESQLCDDCKKAVDTLVDMTETVITSIEDGTAKGTPEELAEARKIIEQYRK